MAEADRFLYDALVQSACLPASAEGVELKDLTSGVFVSIVWRCLARIQEGEEHLEFQIPEDLDAQGGVAARHRVGSQLANILKELGYAGDCGYNHFLYPNEKESRSILSWLVGKLPGAEEIKIASSATLTEANTSATTGGRGCLAEQPLAEVFSLWMKKKTLYRIPNRDIPALRGFEKLPLRTSRTSLPWSVSPDSSTPLFTSVSEDSSQAVSVLEAIAVAQRRQTINIDNLEDVDDAKESASDFGGRIEDDSGYDDVGFSASIAKPDDEDSIATSSSAVMPPFFISAAAAIKENAMAQLEAAAEIQDQHPAGNLGGAQLDTDISQELDALKEDSDQASLEQMHVRLMEAQQRIDQLRDEAAADQDELLAIQARVEETKSSGVALKKELAAKRQLLELLPQADDNVAKLEAICAKNELKLEELANEWAAHKRPLEDEEQALLSMKSTRKARCRQFVAEMKSFRTEMKEMAATIREKMETLHVLDKTYASLPQNINRNSYTNRIMDIIKQVHKQKQEIGRIIEDIKSIQKQLNFSSEKLKRSEAVTEEKLFGEASKQVSSSKDPNNPYVECYRKFAQVRELFEELILVVGDVGKKENAARDLENWITQLQGRDSSEQLDRVLADLQSVRQENASLGDQIRVLRLKQ